MRRSIVALVGAAAVAFSGSAYAKDTRVTMPGVGSSGLLPTSSACDSTLPSPDAIACAGYFHGNLNTDSPADIINAQDAIELLPGDFTYDGNRSAVPTITALMNGNQINFGQTLFGQTIIGADFSDVAGSPATCRFSGCSTSAPKARISSRSMTLTASPTRLFIPLAIRRQFRSLQLGR